jgi:hypothetical protein
MSLVCFPVLHLSPCAPSAPSVSLCSICLPVLHLSPSAPSAPSVSLCSPCAPSVSICFPVLHLSPSCAPSVLPVCSLCSICLPPVLHLCSLSAPCAPSAPSVLRCLHLSPLPPPRPLGGAPPRGERDGPRDSYRGRDGPRDGPRGGRDEFRRGPPRDKEAGPDGEFKPQFVGAGRARSCWLGLAWLGLGFEALEACGALGLLRLVGLWGS